MTERMSDERLLANPERIWVWKDCHQYSQISPTEPKGKRSVAYISVEAHDAALRSERATVERLTKVAEQATALTRLRLRPEREMLGRLYEAEFEWLAESVRSALAMGIEDRGEGE